MVKNDRSKVDADRRERPSRPLTEAPKPPPTGDFIYEDKNRGNDRDDTQGFGPRIDQSKKGE